MRMEFHCPQCGTGGLCMSRGLCLCPRCHRDVDRPGITLLAEQPGLFRLERVEWDMKEAGVWAFGPLLPPLPQWARVSLQEGHTPLIRAKRLGRRLGFNGELWLKDEGRNPTGSFKDRLAAVLVSEAVHSGAETLVLVSSGNMGAAIAAYGAVAGLEVVVIVPPGTAGPKVSQMMAYGARVVSVRGTGSDRLGLCLEAVQRLGWYNVNSPFNPLGVEGTKTAAYEVWTALGERLPDWVVVPVGFGCNLVGHGLAMRQLVSAHANLKMPRLVAVQPEGSPSVVVGYERGVEHAVPGPQDTIAGGISQRVTLHGYMVLRLIRESGGTAVAVSDGEMLDAVRMLAECEGVYAEPSAAAAVAGFARLMGQGRIAPHECVLLVVTATGLKEKGDRGGSLPTIDPSLQQLESCTRR